MTDIGVPDPAEPVMVVIPAAEPVPGFVERFKPGPAQEREPKAT